MNDKLIQCKCGHVLMKGNASIFFGKGTSIECKVCGNKHVFGKDKIIGTQPNNKDEGISLKKKGISFEA